MNDQEFDSLYKKHSAKFKNIATKMLSSKSYHHLDDILQISWYKAYKYIDTFDGKSFEKWFYLILLNTTRTYSKRNKINESRMLNDEYSLEIIDTKESSDSSAEARLVAKVQLKKLVDLANEVLTKQQLRVFKLVGLDQLTYHEAAEELELSYDAAKTHYLAAIWKLQESGFEAPKMNKDRRHNKKYHIETN